jgi:hypothetical protein
MTGATMWQVCAQAAQMLDAASSDWRRLLEVEDTLWPLATALERASGGSGGGHSRARSTRQADPDLALLHSSLTWFREHEYDALETELQRQLDIALRCAIAILDRLDQSQPMAETSDAVNQHTQSEHGATTRSHSGWSLGTPVESTP